MTAHSTSHPIRSLALLCVAFSATVASVALAANPPAVAPSATTPAIVAPTATVATVSKNPSAKSKGSASTAAGTPAKALVIPAPPIIDAGAWILMDASTGQVFAENNADTRLEPASLTKIMTAYTVFDAIHSGEKKLTDTALISEHAWRTGGSRTFLDLNTQVPVQTLILGMVIQSGNDASVALAEYVAGTEQAFTDLMNHHAEQLGMVNTHFEDATGLPIANHYSSARDLAILSKALIQRFPEEYKWFSTKEFTFHGIVQHNRDVLLNRDSAVDGIKTGFTDAAGYCLISSAKHGDMRLISVVLHAASPAARAREAQSLLDYGFRFWETHQVQVGQQSIATARVWKGAQPTFPVGVSDDLYVTVPRGLYKTVSTTFELQKHIIAPVTEGQIVGTAHMTLPEGKTQDYPLVALAEVAQGSWWRRLIDTILLWFS